MTNREIVSEIQSDLRAKQVDDYVSTRHVLSKLIDNNALFLKRENDTNKLFFYEDIWTTVNCLEMKPADPKMYCGYSARFVHSITISEVLPKMYSYSGGSLIKEVTTLDGSVTFHQTTKRDYENIMRREYRDKAKKYFWIEDDRLIIPDGPEAVRIVGCFISPWKARKFDSCRKHTCELPLDDTFPSPPHIRSIVKEKTVNDLFSFYKRVPTDNNPNGDNNIKTDVKQGQ